MFAQSKAEETACATRILATLARRAYRRPVDTDLDTLLGFYDAGRVAFRQGPPSSDATWLKGVGWGVGVGDVRIDFGYKLDDVPGSLQVLLRFGRTF